MSSKGKKRKRSASPDTNASETTPIQKLRIKPIPEIPAEEPTSGKKHSKKQKHQVSPISSSSISPPGDGGEDGGLKMKFFLSPKKVKVEASPESDAQTASPSHGTGKGKKKEKLLKATLLFEDQVLTLDGETVTHQAKPGGKKGKLSQRTSDIKQSPEQSKSSKKKKEPEKVKVKTEEPTPPFTKVPKSAERVKAKVIKVESDSGYSDTPTSSAKGKKVKVKMQTVEELPVPSPQASDISRDSLPKKKKKDKDKKKKKMFKFKGDRNRFLNVRDFSDDEAAAGVDSSLSRSYPEDDGGFTGPFDAEDDRSRDHLDSMMPQMPVPDYSLERQASEEQALSAKTKARRDERKEREIQSSRAEDLISQLTANGSEMETIYPSYMLAPEKDEMYSADGRLGWIKKKKKKKKLSKEKKKKKKLKVLERDEKGNVKYVIRKTKISGYMLWCRSYRPTFVAQNPGLDFSTISRRMGALWQTLDEHEKKHWRKREITVNTKVPVTRLRKERHADTPPFELQVSEKQAAKSAAVKKRAAAAAAAKKRRLEKKKQKKKKQQPRSKLTLPRWEPIDCAAYMRLLGASLSDVGKKLQTHKQGSEVHGSISVLLDSMLCAMGPLLCLTDQLPETNSLTKKTKSGLLDNIAYIMPGL